MTNIDDDAKLTDMETDVIGEVMNISMGSAATALSTVLDTKVNITTPKIESVPIEDFEFTYLEPVIGVIIRYVEGIDGSNVLLMKEEDMKKILCHLLSMEMTDDFEFDEISTSAICEIMNQMMGSAASALASFLGKPINISPPEILDVANKSNVRELFAIKGDHVVSINFHLSVEGIVESEFISALEPRLAKEMVQMTLGLNDMEESGAAADSGAPAAPQAETAPAPQQEAAMQPAPQPQAAVPPQPQAAPQPQAMPPQPEMMPAGYPPQPGYPPQGYPMQPGYPPQGYPMQPGYPAQQMYQQPMQPIYASAPQPQVPKPQVNASQYTYKSLGDDTATDDNNSNNLELIMSVPIQLTVELGRTKRKIKDIVELYQGNIVELDRQAGDQVDIMANGRLIAKGDVVVVDDNYSVRITEIIKSKETPPV